MRALDITKHKTNLTNILIDFYKEGSLGRELGFKGGTAAMMFYDLPRFSTDLDFDLLSKHGKDSKEFKDFVSQISSLLSSKYDIKDYSNKYNTLFWLISYKDGLSNIKIEVSTRENPHNHYGLLSLYGITVKTLIVPDMIAHKMVAVTERPSIANRDLFDLHYFLGTPYASEINYQIIKYRTNKTPIQFYKDLYNFINNIDPKSVLSGLGEVLDQSQKDWAKSKLITDLLILIQRQQELLSK